MNVACTNGIRLEGQKVVLFPRNGSDYEQWTLDVASGQIIEFSNSPAKGGGAPEDSHSDLTGGKARTLSHPENAFIMPSGFEPFVFTDRFLFAKRSRLRFSYLHFLRDGVAIVIDRGTGKIVWTQIGINIAIFASGSHVFICDQQKTAAFSISAGRPREVSDFYSAVRAGDLVKARQLYPFRHKTQLFDLNGSGPLTVAAKENQR